MIDMTKTKAVLDHCNELVGNLHGEDLDERDALVSQSRGQDRKRKAKLSSDLQFLATRLELAAALVRVEYWFARGDNDPTDPDRLA